MVHVAKLLFGQCEKVNFRFAVYSRLSKKKGGVTMAKVAAFHSKLSGTSVYHDNNQCTEGNNIEAKNRASGTGGRPKCDHCKRLG